MRSRNSWKRDKNNKIKNRKNWNRFKKIGLYLVIIYKVRREKKAKPRANWAISTKIKIGLRKGAIRAPWAVIKFWK